jgi:large subunit ribosomal protein L22
MATQTAKLNYLKIAPRKVRLIANTLKGLSTQEAEAQLMFRSQRSSGPLLILLRSAIANAKNNKMDISKLFVSTILVNPGPMLKRMMPRAQGRGAAIHKKMSHVVLILSEKEVKNADRFIILPPAKKVKESHDKAHKPKTEEVKKEGGNTKKPGVFKRMFRRTAV